MITSEKARAAAYKKIGKEAVAEMENAIDEQITLASTAGLLKTTFVVIKKEDLFESVLIKSGFEYKKNTSLSGVVYVVSWL